MEVQRAKEKKSATDLHKILQYTLLNTSLLEIDSRRLAYILDDLLVYAALYLER